MGGGILDVAIARKAFVWGLFAAGGTLTALLFPAVMGLFLLVSLGYVPAGLDYNHIVTFAAGWIGKVILFGVVFLSLWHAAHRMRVICHDFGIRADGLVASLLYVLASMGSVLLLCYLWLIRPLIE